MRRAKTIVATNSDDAAQNRSLVARSFPDPGTSLRGSRRKKNSVLVPDTTPTEPSNMEPFSSIHPTLSPLLGSTGISMVESKSSQEQSSVIHGRVLLFNLSLEVSLLL